MDKEITISEAARHLEEHLDRASSRGDRILLTRNGETIAELKPVSPGKRLGDLPDLLASLPRLSKSEVELLASDLEEIRSTLFQPNIRNPWGS